MNKILDNPEKILSIEDYRCLEKLAPALDAEGVMPCEAVDVITKNRHFHLFVPEDRGGLDLTLVQGMKIIEAYALIEGNLGWIVQIGAGGGIFAAYLEESIADRFLGRSDQVIAGSDFLGGIAKPVPDGYLVSGTWGYASGAHHATAFTGSCRIETGIDKGKVRAVMVPAEQVKVIPNWNAMGMRATDSHTFQMEDVFVSEGQFFSLESSNLKVPTRTANLPFTLYARALFMPVLTGIGCKYHLLFSQYLEADNQKRHSQKWGLCDELWNTLSESRKELYDQADRVWQSTPPEAVFLNAADENEKFRLMCLRVTEGLMNILDKCHWHLGMKGVRMDEPLNIAYRNFKTVVAHHLLRP